MKTPVELTLIELSPGGIDLEMFLEIDGALSKTNTAPRSSHFLTI